MALALWVAAAFACGSSSRPAGEECDADADGDTDADSDGDVPGYFCPGIGVGCTDATPIDAVLLAVCSLSRAAAEAAWEVDVATRRICRALAIDGCDDPSLEVVVANVNAELAARFAFTESYEATWQPHTCAANLDTARSIAAWCEGGGDPTAVELSCEGLCTGRCSGTCSGLLSCDVAARGVACDGACEGACDLAAAGACGGTCFGSCDASCSCTDADGECRGTCEGNCAGACRLDGAASCSGSCFGRCLVDPGDAACTAGALCRGSCDAECAGECDGIARAIDASVECQTAAAVEGVVGGSCEPPDLDIDFTFSGGAEDRAAFVAAVAALDEHFPSLVAAVARMDRIVDAAGELSGPLTALVDTDVEVDAEALVCLAERIPAAADLLVGATARLTVAITAAVSLTACVFDQTC